MRIRSAAAALLASLALSGCGYHVGGRADLMPKTVRTIAIPAFANGTTRHALARSLAADITREFISRTRYVIVADPNEADAILNGDLANIAVWPVASDPQASRAAAVQVVVTLNINLTERNGGKVLYSRNGAEFHERYEISRDPRAYFDESGPAVDRLSRDVARSVVSAILEDF